MKKIKEIKKLAKEMTAADIHTAIVELLYELRLKTGYEMVENVSRALDPRTDEE